MIQYDFIKKDTRFEIRYAFYQFPFDFPSYEEYLLENDFTLEGVGDMFLEEYEQQLIESQMNTSTLMIRYDYNEEQYLPGIHSTSHFHIGFQNSTRIPVAKVITPFVFTLFIIRQVYYNTWKRYMQKSPFLNKVKTCKNLCTDINQDYFKDDDTYDLYLS